MENKKEVEPYYIEAELQWIGYCKKCNVFYTPIKVKTKWFSASLCDNSMVEISRPKCCCPCIKHTGHNEFEQMIVSGKDIIRLTKI